MITIMFEKENCRSAVYDGEVCIGVCDYKEQGATWVLDHTAVDPAYGGQGIAGKLVEETIKQARVLGKKIVPVCSFVKKELERKAEYRDMEALVL